MRYRTGVVGFLFLSVATFGMLGCNFGSSGGGGGQVTSMVADDQACNVSGGGNVCAPISGALAGAVLVSEIPGNPPLASGNIYQATPSNLVGMQEKSFNLALPGNWQSQVIWPQTPLCNTGIAGQCVCPPAQTSGVITFTAPNAIINWRCPYTGPNPQPVIVYANALPTTLTINEGSFAYSSTHGMPTMYLYQQNGNGPIGSVTATSVASDGSSVTFPFPTQSNGSPLPVSMYAYVLSEPDPGGSGATDSLGLGYLTVVNDATATTPYGIASYDVGTSLQTYLQIGTRITNTIGPLSSVPNYGVTLASLGQFCLNGILTCTTVGTTPVALGFYNFTTTEVNKTGECTGNPLSPTYSCDYKWTNQTAPQSAIVANFGSNNVSIVNLSTMVVTATLPVGTQPVDVLVAPNQSTAFVANYGSNTITEINLKTNTVAATLAVGAAPASLTMDPGGNDFWIGGNGYLSEVSLSSFSVVSTTPVSGQVTALAISAALNSWVYTTISSDRTTFTSQAAVITTGTPVVNFLGQMSTADSDYVLGGGSSSTPPPYLKASIIVSGNLGNGLAVTSTPTGYQVLDLVAHTVLESSNTPSPVRGLAVDVSQSMAYLTAPDSGHIYTVPVPAPDAE